MRLVRHPDCSCEDFKEVVRGRKVDGEVQLSQNKFFHRDDLGFRACVICHVDEVLDGRWVDLLVLGSDHHASDAEKLHLVSSNLVLSEESIGQVYCDVQCFSLKFEPDMYIDKPVNKDDPHVLIDFSLMVHVVGLWVKHGLFTSAPEVDVVGMFETIERNPFNFVLVLPESGWVDIGNP
jgi:hypothetical protein